MRKSRKAFQIISDLIYRNFEIKYASRLTKTNTLYFEEKAYGSIKKSDIMEVLKALTEHFLPASIILSAMQPLELLFPFILQIYLTVIQKRKSHHFTFSIWNFPSLVRGRPNFRAFRQKKPLSTLKFSNAENKQTKGRKKKKGAELLF